MVEDDIILGLLIGLMLAALLYEHRKVVALESEMSYIKAQVNKKKVPDNG